MPAPPHPLSARSAEDTVAWVKGRPLTVAQLLDDASRLAARLPASGPALNLCQDRYRFSVGLLAALSHRHLSLMPPNALPETLCGLRDEVQEPYAFVDDEAAVPVAQGLKTFVVGSVMDESRGEPGSAPLHEPQAQDPAVCLLTSGSTGRPTAHSKRWDDLKANIAAEAQRLAQMLGRPSLQGTTLVGTVPPQHSYGLESTVLLALLGGAAFESGRPYFPADIVESLASVPRPRALVTTPFHLKTLLESGLPMPPTDLVLCATAPLSPQLAARAEQAMGAKLIEIYGCTEAGQVASRRTTEGETWTALSDLRLTQVSSPQEEPPDSFWVEGGHVRERTRLADLLVLESPTRFRLLGRANDLIHVGGKRSSMGHLNFQLNRVPGVIDGAMWMPPEQADGITRPVAFVVADHRDASVLTRGLRGLLEPVFVPRTVVFVEALPRSDTGKITSAALEGLAREHGLLAPIKAPAATTPIDWQHIGFDHPAFEGHFPGQPILPGVVLLGHVQEQALQRWGEAESAACAITLDQVKFLRFVEPGDDIRVVLQDPPRADGARAFTVEVRRSAGSAPEVPIEVAAKGIITLRQAMQGPD